MKHLLLLLVAAPLCLALPESISFVEPADLPEEFMQAHLGSNDAQVCIDKQLLQCQNSFNWYLNITSDADWTNPTVLIHLIQGFYEQGISGILKLCTARTYFQQCLGSSYMACMQPTKFLSKGQSLRDAWRYIGVMRELEFQCNGGFLQTTQNWDCILQIQKSQKDMYAQCQDAFHNATQKDPTIVCQASVDFSNCARAPYFVGCGADAGWWECERVRISLNLDQSCPENLCAFNHFLAPQPSSLNKYLSHGEKLAQTQHVSQNKLDFLADRVRRIEKRMTNN
ncbi:unnamed protein product, partial [Mesorhabditis spiculigera]